MLENHVLWASASSFMNDRQEMATGLQLFSDLMKNHSHEVDEQVRENFTYMVRSALNVDRHRTYIACASREPDSLTMWRNYTGGEVGFAVALDTSRRLRMRRQRPLTQQHLESSGFHDGESAALIRGWANDGSPGFHWADSIYDLSAQRKSVLESLRTIEQTALARATGRRGSHHELEAMHEATQLVARLKHPAFRDEAEVRVVCTAPMHADVTFLKHRSSRFGPVPYIELGIPLDSTKAVVDHPEPMENLPIIGIAVGPAPYQEEAFVGVRELLRTLGREDIPVVRSQIPFRS